MPVKEKKEKKSISMTHSTNKKLILVSKLPGRPSGGTLVGFTLIS